MKSPSVILSKDKRLDMLTTDLRKSIERLDKVIYANKSSNSVTTAKKVTPNKQSIYSDKTAADNQQLLLSVDGGVITTGGNSEINFNTQIDAAISVNHANALARKTPLKSISTLKKHSFVASTYSKKSPSIAATNKGIRNNKSIITGINTKSTASKLPLPTQPPQIITQPDEISDKISSKSQQIRGLGQSSASIIESRRNFHRPDMVVNTGRKSEASIPTALKIVRKTSQNSNNSGNNRVTSTNTKSKSKLVPITLTSKNNNFRVESPKKQTTQFARKEVFVAAPYSLNFQRSKSARPQRKSLIQKKH